MKGFQKQVMNIYNRPPRAADAETRFYLSFYQRGRGDDFPPLGAQSPWRWMLTVMCKHPLLMTPALQVPVDALLRLVDALGLLQLGFEVVHQSSSPC